MATGVNNEGGSRITLSGRGSGDQQLRASGASSRTLEHENSTTSAFRQVVEAGIHNPSALQEREYERGVLSNTPNGQVGQNPPDLLPDTREPEGWNMVEHEDRETAAERPSEVVLERTFDDYEDAQHIDRPRNSRGECRCSGNIPASINTYQLRR